MKQTMQTMDNGRGLHITTRNGYVVSIGIGGGHYSDNHHKRFDEPCDETSTMEVAIMRHKDNPDYNPKHNCDFVCLPNDVAGYIPVGRMSEIIAMVEASAWPQVCLLCNESDEDASKFPKKA